MWRYVQTRKWISDASMGFYLYTVIDLYRCAEGEDLNLESVGELEKTGAAFQWGSREEERPRENQPQLAKKEKSKKKIMSWKARCHRRGLGGGRSLHKPSSVLWSVITGTGTHSVMGENQHQNKQEVSVTKNVVINYTHSFRLSLHLGGQQLQSCNVMLPQTWNTFHRICSGCEGWRTVTFNHSTGLPRAGSFCLSTEYCYFLSRCTGCMWSWLTSQEYIVQDLAEGAWDE